LINSIKIVGGKELSQKIDILFESFEKIPEISYYLNIQKTGNFRKISFFPDKELKVRVVAIGDYFSQTALRPLHQFIFRILKRIPQDMTFKQGQFTEDKVEHKVYYSFDLTAATDKFPIKLIRKVLEGRLSKDYVDA
jgi:hypothetical protein